MKPTLILIEGMNIARRSEVTKAVCAKLPKNSFELYICDEKTPIHLFVRMMMDVIEKRKHVVIENGWRADYVHEKTLDSAVRPKQFRRMLDRIALGCNGIIALALGSPKLYAENISNINPGLQYHLVATQVSQRHSAWIEAPKFGLEYSVINTGFEDFREDVDLLMDKALIHSGRNIGPGIGSWNPGRVILMVGDRHGPSIQPYQTQFNLAFCDMAKAGSSYWLSDQLENGEIDERHLYWINAFDKDDVPTEHGFVEQLSPVATLALGDSATRWCQSNAVTSESFSHPQYHKRFLSKEPYPLINRLKQLIKGL